MKAGIEKGTGSPRWGASRGKWEFPEQVPTEAIALPTSQRPAQPLHTPPGLTRVSPAGRW